MKLYPNVTVLFLIWAISILTIFYFGFSSIIHTNLFPNDFLKSFANWDGGHYLGIADGYDKIFQYAFFPFYPLLINLVSRITGNFLTSGIIISVISSYLAFQIFYQLMLLEFGKNNAKKSLYALMIFPMSFYFIKAEGYWHRKLVFSGFAVFTGIKQLFIQGFIVNNFRSFLDLIFSIFGIVAVWRIWKKLGLDYAIFSIVSIFLPLFSPTTLAIPRYLLTIFPIFIMLSFIKNTYVIFFYQILSSMLLAGFAILFITGYWVS